MIWLTRQPKRLGGATQIGAFQLGPFAVDQVITRDHTARLKSVLLEADPQATVREYCDLHGQLMVVGAILMGLRRKDQRAFVLNAGRVLKPGDKGCRPGSPAP